MPLEPSEDLALVHDYTEDIKALRRSRMDLDASKMLEGDISIDTSALFNSVISVLQSFPGVTAQRWMMQSIPFARAR